MVEIFKPIQSYPDYHVSNLGRVKSLKFGKERILKQSKSTNGYHTVCLCENGKNHRKKTHKLVAVAFLNHEPNGLKLVVHHKDNNPLNNRIDNLEVITQRDNCMTHHKGTSKYKGVSWSKSRKKWRAQIYINGEIKNLGRFKCELAALNAYNNALKEFYLHLSK